MKIKNTFYQDSAKEYIEMLDIKGDDKDYILDAAIIADRMSDDEYKEDRKLKMKQRLALKGKSRNKKLNYGK